MVGQELKKETMSAIFMGPSTSKNDGTSREIDSGENKGQNHALGRHQSNIACKLRQLTCLLPPKTREIFRASKEHTEEFGVKRTELLNAGTLWWRTLLAYHRPSAS